MENLRIVYCDKTMYTEDLIFIKLKTFVIEKKAPKKLKLKLHYFQKIHYQKYDKIN